MSEEISLTKAQAKDLAKRIKSAVIAAADQIQVAGRLLLEFRDAQAWQPLGYDSWTECVEKEFRSDHGGRRHIFDLIQNAEVSENVFQNGSNGHLSPSESTKASGTRATGSVLPIRQSRELAKLPAEDQPAAYKKAAESGNGKPSTSAIKKAVEAALEVVPELPPVIPKAKSEKAVKFIVRDSTGYLIPECALPIWNRRDEVTTLLKSLSSARCAVRDAMEKEDILFGTINMSGTLSDLNHAYNNVTMAMPFAVCCTCQGISPDKCASCKGRGFISKEHYNTCVPQELKDIRNKSCVL